MLEKISIFLQLVSEGEQDQVKAMLKITPNLVLYAGDVTDLSKRTFLNITGFQYAVWSLDWHMWTMLREYLPPDAVREQLQGMATGSWVEQHGKFASWKNSVKALDKFQQLGNAGQFGSLEEQWQKIGCLQKLWPAHVVNEYCQPTSQYRPFHPCQDFKLPTPLERNRLTADGDEWFASLEDLKNNPFAFIRRQFDGRNQRLGSMVVRDYTRGNTQFGNGSYLDKTFLQNMLDVRFTQCEELFAEILENKNACLKYK